jgi:hypothetical protein
MTRALMTCTITLQSVSRLSPSAIVLEVVVAIAAEVLLVLLLVVRRELLFQPVPENQPDQTNTLYTFVLRLPARSRHRQLSQ